MKRGQKMAKKTTKIATQKQTQTKKSNSWFVLALIALAILIVNIIFVFAGSQWLIQKVTEAGVQVPENFSQALFTYGIMWLVLAIITIMLLIAYKQKKMHAWWLMLVLGIVVIFTGRIETAVLLIIASFLYKGSLK